MPTMRQLRYLVAAATEGSFVRAAETCHVTQPALSMQIRELEAELATVLFERRRGHLTPTALGLEIVQRARAILVATEDLVAHARHGSRLLTGPLTIGIIPTIAPYLLPRALPALRARFPELVLSVRESQTAPLLRGLSDGEVDVVILSLPIEVPEIATRPLFEDRFLVALPAGGEQRDETRRIDPDELDRHRLLLLEEGHCLRDQALSVCRLADRELMGEIGATSLATILQLVAHGFGITLIPEMARSAEVRDARIALYRLSDPEPSRTIGLAWRRSSPRQADVEALGDALAELAPAASLTSDSPRPA